MKKQRKATAHHRFLFPVPPGLSGEYAVGAWHAHCCDGSTDPCAFERNRTFNLTSTMSWIDLRNVRRFTI